MGDDRRQYSCTCGAEAPAKKSDRSPASKAKIDLCARAFADVLCTIRRPATTNCV